MARSGAIHETMSNKLCDLTKALNIENKIKGIMIYITNALQHGQQLDKILLVSAYKTRK